MPIQRFSFESHDPIWNLGGWTVGLQIITFENAYGLDPARCRVETTPDGWRVIADGLTWAGGQESAEGGAEIVARRLADGDGLTLDVRAWHTRTIRCTKVLIRGLPSSTLLARGWAEEPVTEDGTVYQYPQYLRGQRALTIQTPLVFLREKTEAADGTADGKVYRAFRSLDDEVRCKRIVAAREADGILVELIHEEAAHRIRPSVTVPTWRVERTTDPAGVARVHASGWERAFGLRRWEERADVPAWTRDIAMVAALHGMHWSGYVFNTYDQMLAALRWIAERIDGRRVLAYLPGWEGRYYWQYGDYRPDPRLGGPEGFRRLADGARALGVKLMPMFAANSANSGLENFEQWGAPAQIRTAAGYVEQGNKPDWDGSRSHDPAWQAILNPGAPTWRNRLLDQATALVERYGLEDHAVFYDTSHWWQNDPLHPVYDGLVALRDALRARFPDLLVAGEGWYDALGAVTPVSHGHVPARFADETFRPYFRNFDHLSAGDPSRGSTGVHELGTRPFALQPLARHHWPTVTLVDGSIERAPERVEQVIAQAREYVERFLRGGD